MENMSNETSESSLAGSLGDHLAAFLASLSEGVLVLNRAGGVLGGNTLGQKLLGMHAVAPGTPWCDAMLAPPQAALASYIDQALGGRPEGKWTEVVLGPATGSSGRRAEIRCSLLAGEGEVDDVLVFYIRETGRTEKAGEPRQLLRKHPREERVEDELRRERSMFEQLMNTVPDKIFFKDLEGRFLRIGRTHVVQFGLKSAEEAVGKTDFDFFAEPYARETHREEQEIIRSGRPVIGKEHKLILADGTVLWVSVTKVPLRDPEGEIIGIIGVARDITERKVAEKKLRERNEEMQADLKMAYEVQQSLLTLNYPDFSGRVASCRLGLHFNHCYRPVSTLAGDFFEIFRISDTQAGVLICDVVGHGVRAALVTAYLRGLVGEIMPSASDPGAFLAGMNEGLLPVLRQADSPMFVTAFFGVADTAAGEFRYANAGHPLPFLQRAGGKVLRMAPSAGDPEPALGLIDGFAYSVARQGLLAGDRMVLFTDGLFEVESARGEPFGEHRIEGQLWLNPEAPAPDLLDLLTGAACSHADSDTFADDVCIIVVDALEVREAEA